ncbi:Glycosylphosphatidylinositol anchor attachment 1 protein [Toxocara canis]|uniref:Glycosylphosphatidylinositol anchor attachment 1 protein n=1 Tax=Toxocara canis TaxID=6265 RepID=A0A0B2UWC2_TOXCA|nr:Glycosylphosphatidylinositol anchor attachment 1 protein [Toxocara canis]
MEQASARAVIESHLLSNRNLGFNILAGSSLVEDWEKEAWNASARGQGGQPRNAQYNFRMRTLTQSSGQRPRIVERLVLKWKPICLLSELLCVLYMAVLMLPEYNERTRISENALLPALVQEHFSYPERIAAFLKALPRQTDMIDYVKNQLGAYGIEADIQTFDVLLPGYNMSARNVYGIVRSGRSPSVESILVAVPLDIKSSGAIATVLALATHCREQHYWARDLVFVFVEESTIGMRAFLDAYHARQHQFIRADRLRSHSGAIVGAFAPRTSGTSFSALNIEFNMLNGQLPNLDLVSLMVRLADKFGLTPTIYEKSELSTTWQGIAEVAARGAITQAFANDGGLHSVFSLYAIQGVSIHVKGDGDERISFLEFARICEGALRSLNNILEKFHQSYFLYILPSPKRFISFAYYMPSVGILLFPLIVLALREWFTTAQFRLSNSYIMFHLIGLGEYIVSTALSLCSLCAFSAPVSVLLLLLPYYVAFPLRQEYKISTRFAFYVEFCLLFGSVSLLNFSMAFIISLIAMPFILVFTLLAESRRGKQLKAVLGFATHPLFLFVVCQSLIADVQGNPVEGTLRTASGLLRSHILLDSFIYPFIFIVLLPLWNILMQIAACE